MVRLHFSHGSRFVHSPIAFSLLPRFPACPNRRKSPKTCSKKCAVYSKQIFHSKHLLYIEQTHFGIDESAVYLLASSVTSNSGQECILHHINQNQDNGCLKKEKASLCVFVPAYTRLVAEIPRQTGQTCPAWPDSWPWKERMIWDRPHKLSMTCVQWTDSCSSSVPFMYILRVCIWHKNMTVYACLYDIWRKGISFPNKELVYISWHECVHVCEQGWAPYLQEHTPICSN